jgi:lipopolysaccharide biosynthesis glycosyltransferase
MSFDDNYIVPAVVTLESLRRKTKRRFEVYFINLDKMLSKEKEELLRIWAKEAKIKIYFKDIQLDEEKFNFKTDSRLSLATYGKIFAISSMDKPFVYLDSDIYPQDDWDCVFDELSKVIANDFPLGAKFETIPNASTSTNLAIRQAGYQYFNAGVLLVNPSRINSQRTIKAAKKLLDNYEANGFWSYDQDLLNSIFLGEVLHLPLKYNQNLWISAQSQPRLVHVEGFYKPWKMSKYVFSVFLLIPIFTDFFCLFTKGKVYSRTKIFIDYKRQENKTSNYLNVKLVGQRNSGSEFDTGIRKTLTINLIFQNLYRRARGDDSAMKY